MRQADEGYTLTEMLVVIAIIGLLVAALTPVLVGQLSRARAKTARMQVENVATSLESFRSDVGRYPSPEEGLSALVRQPAGASGWLGPYIKNDEALLDPWGHKLLYRASDVGAPQVTSLGADGKPGGAGVAADITGG